MKDWIKEIEIIVRGHFISGSDMHGTPIVLSVETQGITPCVVVKYKAEKYGIEDEGSHPVRGYI